MGVTLPLLVIVPFTFGIMFPHVVKPKFRLEDGMKKGELILYEQDVAFQTSIFITCGKYVLFHGMRVRFLIKSLSNLTESNSKS